MLFCINELCDAVDSNIVEECLLPTIIDLSKDKVANVRFNVAKTLAKMETILEPAKFDMKVNTHHVIGAKLRVYLVYHGRTVAVAF